MSMWLHATMHVNVCVARAYVSIGEYVCACDKTSVDTDTRVVFHSLAHDCLSDTTCQ
jgi:hypothetical protein